MGTVDSPSSIKPGLYGDSKSGEVSYLDLQNNSFLDLRARKHTPTQAGDFQDPTNFIRNQISQTLHMRPRERTPIPLPRRTFDTERRDDKWDDTNLRDNLCSESPASLQSRSPDVSLLRSHINIGGTSVRLRNPQRLSSGRKAKTMSWMEPPSRKVKDSSSKQRRHSNITNDENISGMLKKMDERRRMIENDRAKNMDRRDYIEKEKRLREDLWSNQLSNLQKELDAAILGNDIQSPNVSEFRSSINSNHSSAAVDPPKVMVVSENNNNNNMPGSNNNSTYIVNSTHPNTCQSQELSHTKPGTTDVKEAYVKTPTARVRKNLQFERGDHQSHLAKDMSNTGIVTRRSISTIMSNTTDARPNNASTQCHDTDWRSGAQQSGSETQSRMGNEKEQQEILEFLDLPTSHNEHKISSTRNLAPSPNLVSGCRGNRLNTFNMSNPTTSNCHDVPIVSPYKSCSEVKVTVENPSESVINVSGVTRIVNDTNVGLHEQENHNPNFLSTYDSFAHKITSNSSNQSTPQKSDLTPLEEFPDKVEAHDDETHHDSSMLTKTADRNRKGGEGFELVDDTTPNTTMAKKKEMFLLKQLKKEEELKRKRAERERDEERKKGEARIRQEEINAKREEEKLKRQQILEEYKKRKMEQEESQRMRETGDIIASAKKHPKPMSSKGSHNSRKGLPYASSLAGSVSNISDAGIAMHSDVDGYAGSVRSAPPSTKRLSTGYRLDWETESAFSSIVNTEYNGPKLYKEPSLKSNKHIINNAICHCCLPGKVNESTRLRALQILDSSEARHFMILFRDSKCQFRALYIYDPDSEKLSKLDGNGPSTILPAMIDCLYKYNSGRKFFASLPSKTLSVSIDAVTIKNSLWQTSKRGKFLKK